MNRAQHKQTSHTTTTNKSKHTNKQNTQHTNKLKQEEVSKISQTENESSTHEGERATSNTTSAHLNNRTQTRNIFNDTTITWT